MKSTFIIFLSVPIFGLANAAVYAQEPVLNSVTSKAADLLPATPKKVLVPVVEVAQKTEKLVLPNQPKTPTSQINPFPIEIQLVTPKAADGVGVGVFIRF